MVLIVFIGVAFLGGVLWFLIDQNAISVKAKARDDYSRSLQSLALAPTDPNLKQLALQLGREYSELTRAGNGVATFDEIAVMNDLNAACAAAGATAASSSSSPVPASDEANAGISSRLAELKRLRDAGLVSEEEYGELRSQLLARLTAV